MSSYTETIAHTLSFINTGWATGLTIYLTKTIPHIECEIEELKEVIIDLMQEDSNASELSQSVQKLNINISEIGDNISDFDNRISNLERKAKSTSIERDISKIKDQLILILDELNKDEEIIVDIIKPKQKHSRRKSRNNSLENDIHLFR